MGIFSKLFGQQDSLIITAPVDGEAIEISKVKDETFSQEILGKGIGVIPSTADILAPADGTITMIFPTGHAFTMETEDGIELLVHIGIDTVNLKGEHFEKRLEEGAVVKKGTAVIHADLDAIAGKGYDTTVVMVICNSDQFQKVEVIKEGPVSAGDNILGVTKN